MNVDASFGARAAAPEHVVEEVPASGNGAVPNGKGDAPFGESGGPLNVPSSAMLPVGLEFKDVEYAVRVVADKKEGPQMKPILRGLSGSILPGEMLCILGPSGGGKTSLIQALCGRLRPDGGRVTLRGAVRCNGEELSPAQFRRISGLVTQEDVLNAAIRVRETLEFAARLRLPAAIRKERVDRVIALLQLEKCAQTFVGDDSMPELKGISGGEKRRLAIATEILDPTISLLVLDEPTSGLDAASALNVANLLRSLADSGLTVVATLHQPRPAIIEQFQKLMVLAEGRTTYLGTPAGFVGYFERIGCRVPTHEVPTDWLLDVLNPAIGSAQQTLGEALAGHGGSVAEGLAARYAEQRTAPTQSFFGFSCGEEEGRQALRAHVRRAGQAGKVSWAQQFLVLLHRTFLVKLREPISLATQVGQALFMGALFGVLYFDSYDKEPNLALLDTQMALAMVLTMAAWMPFDVLLTFPRERRIYRREQGAGLYSTSAFFFARILADLPGMLLSAVLMSLITWPMIGFRMALPGFIGLNCVAIMTGAALLQMVGALSANFEQANMLSMVVLMLAMMLSPAFIRKVPEFLRWARDISFIGVLSEMAMYLEFQQVGELDSALTPADVFELYGVNIRNEEDFTRGCLLLLLTWLGARLITYLAVRYLHTGRPLVELCSGN